MTQKFVMNCDNKLHDNVIFSYIFNVGVTLNLAFYKENSL